jgi:hypothetical protein
MPTTLVKWLRRPCPLMVRNCLLWIRTWTAHCGDLSEWRAIQVPFQTTDRLQCVPAPGGRPGNAMRVEVRDGDTAWNPHANNGAGAPIAGGWRAEAVGPEETATTLPVRYGWSTWFDASYPANPVVSAPDPEQGDPIWQVVTQWHQGDNDSGGPPPVEFIVVQDQIALHLNRPDSSEVGVWLIAPLARDTWHDFAAHIRWDLTDGWIRVWHNGTPVQFTQGGQPTEQLAGLQTLFPPKPGLTHAPSAYLKMGLYRKAAPDTAPGPFILYHDDVIRAVAVRFVRWPIYFCWPSWPWRWPRLPRWLRNRRIDG